MATFLNSTKLLTATPNEYRERVMLCRGQLQTITRYIGLHCKPLQMSNGTMMYCFFTNKRNNTPSNFLKVVIKKIGSNLCLEYRVCDYSFFDYFLNGCCNMTLNDLRCSMMSVTGVYVYTSVEEFILHIRCYDYRYLFVRQCTESEFNRYH